LSSDTDTSLIDNDVMLHIYNIFIRIINDVKNNNYSFSIIYDNDTPIEFAPFKLNIYKTYEHKDYDSVSSLISDYYMQKSNKSRIKQKSNDIRKLINNSIERASKKYDFMLKQLEDTKKKEKYKIYGELINTYGYSVEPGSKSFKALNYYTNEEITIPLDPLLSPLDNGKRYFERYNKLKRTFDAVTIQAEETYSKLQHLESISNALDIAQSESDINDIKKELIEYGYMKKKAASKNEKKGKKNTKSNQPLSKPLHYLSSDGFHMYVGKNNYQNDELTFKFASGNDWWFHAKGYAGSHVIVKTNGEELPDRTFEEAGMLAAYYSKEKDLEKAEVDYTLKKNIKKPNNAKPGFVVYYTNYSLIVKPDISNIQLIND
ncbi:MAG: NFACT family protein, partial [Lachnospiraceae bacterium]|nr:NFACT family protein [Lachnospiraceae bacterium]